MFSTESIRLAATDLFRQAWQDCESEIGLRPTDYRDMGATSHQKEPR